MGLYNNLNFITFTKMTVLTLTALTLCRTIFETLVIGTMPLKQIVRISYRDTIRVDLLYN